LLTYTIALPTVNANIEQEARELGMVYYDEVKINLDQNDEEGGTTDAQEYDNGSEGAADDTGETGE
jgi:hypothetical protein